jgi:hypothetical protein
MIEEALSQIEIDALQHVGLTHEDSSNERQLFIHKQIWAEQCREARAYALRVTSSSNEKEKAEVARQKKKERAMFLRWLDYWPIT